MNENEVLQEDEISLFDLWETLQNAWKTVVGVTALGIAGALGAIFIISPKYEAVAVVQVGQVGQVGQGWTPQPGALPGPRPRSESGPPGGGPKGSIGGGLDLGPVAWGSGASQRRSRNGRFWTGFDSAAMAEVPRFRRWKPGTD